MIRPTKKELALSIKWLSVLYGPKFARRGEILWLHEWLKGDSLDEKPT